ncbi:MAG: Crp/Fnr family transcriptional regulator [Clostridia bacterium]|nr:Crp/Fnr family transcriptional regulator [Clostridia bacterium]
MNNREVLEKQEFWKYLSEDEKNLVMSDMYNLDYAKDSILHNNSQTCLGLVIVKTGLLRVYFTSPQGREYTLYFIKPGELCIMSAACIMDEVSFDIYVSSEEDTQITVIGARVFRQIMQKNNELQIFSYKTMANRFSEIMNATQNILFYGIDTRLADSLLQIEVDGEAKVTQENLAQLIGSAREVVTRMLGEFEKDGIIKTGRGKITILKKQKLLEIAQKK